MPITFLLTLVTSLAVIGLGAVVAATACLILALILALGLLSTSTLIGIIQRSPPAGFRAFFVQLGILLGGFSGALLAWLICLITGAVWKPSTIVIIGGGTGAALGLAMACIFNLAWGKLSQFVCSLINRKHHASTDQLS